MENISIADIVYSLGMIVMLFMVLVGIMECHQTLEEIKAELRRIKEVLRVIKEWE